MGRKPEIIIDKLKDKIINEIWTFFETKKEGRKNKKNNDRQNKGYNNFRHREIVWNKKKKKNQNENLITIIFGIIITSNMKVMAIKIETYHLIDILNNWNLLEKHNG